MPNGPGGPCSRSGPGSPVSCTTWSPTTCSVIAIQAEAAPYRVPEPPEELARSFAAIRATATDGLRELRRVVGVLRADGAADDPDPQPTLERLDELVAAVEGAGLQVTVQVSGTPRPLPAGVELSAYRIV